MINNLHFVQLSALLLLLLSFATSCQNDCPDNCSGNGRCEIDQSCTCDPGFTGLACEFEDSCNAAALTVESTVGAHLVDVIVTKATTVPSATLLIYAL